MSLAEGVDIKADIEWQVLLACAPVGVLALTEFPSVRILPVPLKSGKRKLEAIRDEFKDTIEQARQLVLPTLFVQLNAEFRVQGIPDRRRQIIRNVVSDFSVVQVATHAVDSGRCMFTVRHTQASSVTEVAIEGIERVDIERTTMCLARWKATAGDEYNLSLRVNAAGETRSLALAISRSP